MMSAQLRGACLPVWCFLFSERSKIWQDNCLSVNLCFVKYIFFKEKPVSFLIPQMFSVSLNCKKLTFAYFLFREKIRNDILLYLLFRETCDISWSTVCFASFQYFAKFYAINGILILSHIQNGFKGSYSIPLHSLYLWCDMFRLKFCQVLASICQQHRLQIIFHCLGKYLL
jgi:hypothetical protein